MATSFFPVDPDGNIDVVLEDANRHVLDWPPADASPDAQPAAPLPQTPDHVLDGSEVRFRVSSSRLSLASPVLKRILDNPHDLDTDHAKHTPRRVVIGSKWDVEAMQILLRTIHGELEGSGDQIPRTIPLEQLAKIAALANHYKCQDAVNPYATAWMTALLGARSPPPAGDEGRVGLSAPCGREAMLWIFIGWVFGQKNMFASMGVIAIIEAQGPLQNMGLPLPGSLVFAMDNARHKSVEDILDGMFALRDTLIDPERQCPRIKARSAECSAMLLGQLMRFLRELGFEHGTQPTRPFYGISVGTLVGAVAQMADLRWREDDEADPAVHPCDLRRLLQPLTTRTLDEIPRLDLEDFPPSKEIPKPKSHGPPRVLARRRRPERPLKGGELPKSSTDKA
ncbi:hypothetical protein MN608_10915 [Microdochium nivale]|nr:hypothetical protein MN608_10915 [Microdochium nivale]